MLTRTSSCPQLSPQADSGENKQPAPTSNARIDKPSYCGRLSLTKIQRDNTRFRKISGSSRDRSARPNAHTYYDDVCSYKSLLEENDVDEHALEISGPPAALSCSTILENIRRAAPNRCELHTRLRRIFCSGATYMKNENLALGSVHKASQQVSLISKNNKRYKWSDVLWLQLQATISGREMKTFLSQVKSTSEHDNFLVGERERQKAIMREIRSFRLPDIIESEPSSGSASPSSSYDKVRHDTMKTSVKTVRALLEKFEAFSTLFPSFASLQKITNMDEVVKKRIDILYAWYNITMDIYEKIREVGGILGIYKDEHSSRRSTGSPSVVQGTASTDLVPSQTWPTLDSPEETRSDGTQSLLSSVSPSVSSSMLTTQQEFGMHLSTSSDLPALLEQPYKQYSEFVSRSLRLKGMRKVLQRLDTVCAMSVHRAFRLLKVPITYAEMVDGTRLRIVDYNAALFPEWFDDGDEMQKDGLLDSLVHKPEFKAMNLPSFENVFLFLIRIPLDLVHEWLKMRNCAPVYSDLLTMQTIIEDCHDCIGAAVAVKHKYISLAQSIGVGHCTLQSHLAHFEDDLQEVFKSYLKYVREWAQEEVSVGSGDAEWIERVTHTLSAEWSIAKRFALSVIGGENEVVHRFCMIASDLMRRMVNDYLPEKESFMEECRSDYNVHQSDDMPDSSEDSSIGRPPSQIFVACRHFKSLISQMKERSTRALGFALLLLRDVEICAFYELKEKETKKIFDRLIATNHVLVDLSSVANFNNSYVMFCNESAAESAPFVRILLNFTCSRYQSELPKVVSKCSGYLLIFPITSLADYTQEIWHGKHITIDVDADTVLSLQYLQVTGDVCLIAVNGQSLPKMRDLFRRNMLVEKEFMFHTLEEYASCHDVVIEHTKHLKEAASETCELFFDDLAGKMAEEVLDNRLPESLDPNELESIRATLIQAYNAAFEFHREYSRVVPRSECGHFAVQTLKWAKQWAEFVTKFVHRGDGSPQLWAAQSFQFLVFSTSPQFTMKLSEKEYIELLHCIDFCVDYIIGINNSTTASDNLNESFSSNDDDNNCRKNSYAKQQHTNADRLLRSQRIQMRLHSIDDGRDLKMRREQRIGHVKDGGRAALSLSTYFNVKKRAPFEWQRLEKKIGSGKFGTVYVVMNLTGKFLMAMKQIRIERNDKALLALVDEVENLRSLDHPNLVKYYAIEVHREELLIFMEYCPEGTLETVCREGLLDMRCVRRYTHFLLKGVEYIHMKMIVHRDIKPANIFLGRKDVLKLGDFGSSVRLKGDSTAIGEVADWIGTPAYMAPEVQTLGGKTDLSGNELIGYGRAADIWSVGCVVLEMCTGKPPWHECEQVLQIVFRVGSGWPPTIPPSVQADESCHSFLKLCFQANPLERATAGQLRQHAFANINVEGCGDSQRGSFY